MTNAPSDTPARMSSLAPDLAALDEQTRRAWTEPMAVEPLENGQYVVQSGDGSAHVVHLQRSDCTCGNHGPPEESCCHVQRVAIEINLGRLEPPERPAVCRACGEGTTRHGPDDRPALCESCRLEPGDVVLDRERGAATPLLVVAVTDRRADEVEVPGADCTVAGHGANRSYSPSDPVVEVVYPHSVRVDRPPRRYSFPVSRLARPEDDAGTVQTTLSDLTSGDDAGE